MNHYPRKSRFSWRFYTIAGFLFLCLLGLIGRMIALSIFERPFLLGESKARILRLVDIPAYRGMITDRNQVPLAISAPVDSIWANPQQLSLTSNQFKTLSKRLGLSESTLQAKLQHAKGKEFAYLARRLPPDLASSILAMNIKGIYSQREYRRFYPSAEVTAHVLGFTNVDDDGQEGIELAYNHWLDGQPGQRQVVKDRYGQIVSNLGVVKSPQEGRNLTLSLDSRIQYTAYRALESALPKFHATSGSIVVMDTKRFEILAMVNLPTYNPNARPAHDDSFRNRAVTDLFEPGSTLKTFSIAAALSSHRYTPNSVIDTRPGWMEIGGYVIHDDENNGIASITKILQKSSNIGAAKITLSLPPENWWRLISAFGFGEKTASGFPGEANGILVESRIRRPVELATMSYGYGLSITALQLAQAYGIIASGGVRYPVTFLKTSTQPIGVRVMDEKLAKQMLGLLKAVAEGGSGVKAQIPGYQVGGKTGTAYIASAGGYLKNRYTSSFVGIAPISDPRLVVAVVLHRVQGSIHFGAQVSAPVFAEVMTSALRYMNVPPDLPAQTRNHAQTLRNTPSPETQLMMKPRGAP